MGISTKEFWGKFIGLLPLLMLFFIALNGSSVININFFSINIHYILVYYWVLRQPQSLGYGLIFLSGLISDVVLGLPLGINSLLSKKDTILKSILIYYPIIIISLLSLISSRHAHYSLIIYPNIAILFGVVLSSLTDRTVTINRQ